MIYEYKKGVRPLFLLTVNSECINQIISRLKNNSIKYYCLTVNERKINLFFGKKECIDVIKSFDFRTLSDLTPEQDFMLGVLLGYEYVQQCDRYLKKVKNKPMKNFSEVLGNEIFIIE
jgi:hypothetical protein